MDPMATYAFDFSQNGLSTGALDGDGTGQQGLLEDSGSPQQVPVKKNKGGRPRDPIWQLCAARLRAVPDVS
jgi:hypothetical protein